MTVNARRLQAEDLIRFESCSRGCRDLVNRQALWHALVITRFGQEAAHKLQPETLSEMSVPHIKREYCRLSRQCVPALEIGVTA